jgi:hypothetical protein
MPHRSHRSESWSGHELDALLSRLPLPAADIPDEHMVYRGRNLLFRVHCDGHDLVVKQWGNPQSKAKGLPIPGRPGKARRSYQMAGLVREAGLSTPEPVAWMERSDRIGRMVYGAYICADLNPAVQFRVLHGERWITDHRDLALEAIGNRRELLRGVGRVVAGLHEAHLHHRDLTAGNLLVAPGQADGWSYHLVDLNRMSVKQQIPLPLACASLAQLEVTDKEGRLALLGGYADVRGVVATDCWRLYARALNRHLKLFDLKNRTRRWRQGPQPSPPPPIQ